MDDDTTTETWEEASLRIAAEEARNAPPLSERQRAALQRLVYPRT